MPKKPKSSKKLVKSILSQSHEGRVQVTQAIEDFDKVTSSIDQLEQHIGDLMQRAQGGDLASKETLDFLWRNEQIRREVAETVPLLGQMKLACDEAIGRINKLTQMVNDTTGPLLERVMKQSASDDSAVDCYD